MWAYFHIKYLGIYLRDCFWFLYILTTYTTFVQSYGKNGSEGDWYVFDRESKVNINIGNKRCLLNYVYKFARILITRLILSSSKSIGNASASIEYINGAFSTLFLCLYDLWSFICPRAAEGKCISVIIVIFSHKYIFENGGWNCQWTTSIYYAAKYGKNLGLCTY